MPFVHIEDQYQQKWKIQEDDPLWEEAKAAVESADDGKVVWPIQKLSENRGWGWWTVFKSLDEFVEYLKRFVPDPSEERLVAIDKEYNPIELQDLLQKFGSCLSILYREEGILEAHCVALKESYKAGISVAIAQSESKATTHIGKESEILAENNTFRNTRKLQIVAESQLELIKGWRHSYEWAWDTISRIISLRLGEASIATGRHA